MPNWQGRVVKRLLMGYGFRSNVNRPIRANYFIDADARTCFKFYLINFTDDDLM
jgi:hypothetical protein